MFCSDTRGHWSFIRPYSEPNFISVVGAALVDVLCSSLSWVCIRIQLLQLYQAVFLVRKTLHIRSRVGLWSTTQCLTPVDFRRSFQMNRDDFTKLADKVRDSIMCDEAMGSLRNGAIEPEVQEVVVLHGFGWFLYLCHGDMETGKVYCVLDIQGDHREVA